MPLHCRHPLRSKRLPTVLALKLERTSAYTPTIFSTVSAWSYLAIAARPRNSLLRDQSKTSRRLGAIVPGARGQVRVPAMPLNSSPTSPTSVATTGRLHARASLIEVGDPSYSEQRSRASAAL